MQGRARWRGNRNCLNSGRVKRLKSDSVCKDLRDTTCDAEGFITVSYTHLDVYKRQTVVKPECLYASECLALNYNLDELEILERRIIRKILGPRNTSDG